MSESAGPRLLEVGRINKAHGLKGEVSVNFVTDRVEERTRPGAELFADGVRLEVASSRPHQSRWLVHFVGVTSREGADALRGATLEAFAIDDPTAIFVHELLGKKLVDQYKTDHGPIVAVIDNPASDLMELADGRLVPLAFFIDQTDTTVSVSVPAGLLDDDADSGD